MDEELKKAVAVFRYGVISDFVSGVSLPRGERKRLLSEKCVQKWRIPGSSRTRIGLSTIKGWLSMYAASGNKLESLYPGERNDKGKSRAIDDHSRLILHAEFFLSEGLPCFLDALRKALLMRGLPRKLYVDNGPEFIPCGYSGPITLPKVGASKRAYMRIIGHCAYTCQAVSAGR